MSKSKASAERRRIHALYEQNELASLEQNRNRARSVTVGTAFGGVVEVAMRGDYASLWAILNPTEVVELMHQLGAAVGVEVATRPRQDFAAYRQWAPDAPELRQWAGTPQAQLEAQRRHAVPDPLCAHDEGPHDRLRADR